MFVSIFESQLDVKDIHMITFGVPSYNRARYIAPLVESIFLSEIDEFEILIVEDNSPERELIHREVERLKKIFDRDHRHIRYLENIENKGYDKNLKEIIKNAVGEIIIFIGNDDLVDPGELVSYVNEIYSNPDAVVFLRGYKTFDDQKGVISSTKIINKSRTAHQISDLSLVYRFSAIISGFAVRKTFAEHMQTEKFDGGLFYQIYLSIAALTFSNIYISSTQPVLCRRDIKPDFGSSKNEPEFTAGSYKVEARIRMVESQLEIASHFAHNYADGFLFRYKRAMSQNIAPQIGELQENKWHDMPKLYLYLLRNGIGRNIRSLVILLIFLCFNKTHAAIILNRFSNGFGLSTAK